MDRRHSSGYGEPEGAARLLADETLRATDLVFVLPVYWYSLPAPLKLYLDHWSAWMRAPALKSMDTMKGRSLWAVIVDSDTADEGSALPVIDSLRRTADHMSMQWRGALVGHGNRRGEISSDARAQACARSYFR